MNDIPRRPPNLNMMDQLASEQAERITRHRATPSSQSSSGSSSYAPPQQPPEKLPTPREIFEGLNEYVIGQRQVKIALSVGVHNHYKRLAVREAQDMALQAMQVEAIHRQQQAAQAAAQRRDGHLGVDPNDTYDEDSASFREPSMADLRLNQFGRSSTIVTPPPPSADEDSDEESTGEDATLNKPYCETPNVSDGDNGEDRSIANPNHKIGPEVEDCELDKSNSESMKKWSAVNLSILLNASLSSLLF